MTFEHLKIVGVPRYYNKGEIIYHAGEEPQGIYFLETGIVALTILNASGKEHLLRFFKKGQYFSHRAILANEPYHATTKALEKIRVSFVSKDLVFKYLDENPKAYAEIAGVLARELRKAETFLSIQDSEVMVRIAHSIIYLKELDPERSWTREEIARLASTTETTTIKTLGKLELEGLIEQKGRFIEILNREALLSLQLL